MPVANPNYYTEKMKKKLYGDTGSSSGGPGVSGSLTSQSTQASMNNYIEQVNQAIQNQVKALNGSSNSSGNSGQNVTITPVYETSETGHPSSEYLTGYKYSSFSPSSRTRDYADILEDLENNKPDAYSSRYQSTIDSIIDSIMNREAFNTDDVYNSDLYKNYRDQYIQQGQRAMRDTMGAAAGMTGGYGSTYAQAAGQQAYDNYLSQLGDKTLDIWDRVYDQYLQEGQELYNQLGAVQGQDNIEYGRYRDSVNDYYNDLNYYSGRYDTSYGQDFGEWQSDLAAQQWAEEYAYQKTQDALAQQNWQDQFDYQKEQDAQQLALQQQQLALSAAKAKSSGSSGSSKKSTSQSDVLQYYIDEAKKMLSATDDNNEYLYDSAYVINELYDAGLDTDEVKKVISAAGGTSDLYEDEMKGQYEMYKRIKEAGGK